MSRASRILLVEDESDLAAGIRENLQTEGHQVEIVGDGAAGLRRGLDGEFDLMILDVMLPQLDGYTVCRRLREAGSQVPILFLTAKGEPEDRIRGLEEGGDDYMAKPFRLRELLLRVAAILRRGAWFRQGQVGRRLRFGGHEVDLDRYRARTVSGEEQVLTHKEAMILKLLAEREGEVVSRDEILDVVWGYGAFPSTRTIDNFILRLRRRFEPDPARPMHFHTVHGVGYRFVASPPPDGQDSGSS